MIHFTKEEKSLILSATEIEKVKISRQIEEGFLNNNDLEEITDIEKEIERENVFLSRKQMGLIVYYFGALLDEKEKFDSVDVLMLESKLETMSDLP